MAEQRPAIAVDDGERAVDVGGEARQAVALAVDRRYARRQPQRASQRQRRRPARERRPRRARPSLARPHADDLVLRIGDAGGARLAGGSEEPHRTPRLEVSPDVEHERPAGDALDRAGVEGERVHDCPRRNPVRSPPAASARRCRCPSAPAPAPVRASAPTICVTLSEKNCSCLRRLGSSQPPPTPNTTTRNWSGSFFTRASKLCLTHSRTTAWPMTSLRAAENSPPPRPRRRRRRREGSRARGAGAPDRRSSPARRAASPDCSSPCGRPASARITSNSSRSPVRAAIDSALRAVSVLTVLRSSSHFFASARASATRRLSRPSMGRPAPRPDRAAAGRPPPPRAPP